MPRIDIKIGDYFIDGDVAFRIIDFDGVFSRAVGKHGATITVDVRSDGTVWLTSHRTRELLYATAFEYSLLQLK